MYNKKEKSTIDSNHVLNKIEKTAINKLRSDFISLNISQISVNNLIREIKKIKYLPNNKIKKKTVQLFLLTHYQYYNSNISSPLNTFSLNCGKIYKLYY